MRHLLCVGWRGQLQSDQAGERQQRALALIRWQLLPERLQGETAVQVGWGRGGFVQSVPSGMVDLLAWFRGVFSSMQLAATMPKCLLWANPLVCCK